jgi:hypothetical protein
MFHFVRLCLLSLWITSSTVAFAPAAKTPPQTRLFSTMNKNVAQTQDTSRETIMTFSYDMSLEPKYEKPTYPGTGNGMSGETGEYDVIVIGSGFVNHMFLGVNAKNILYLTDPYCFVFYIVWEVFRAVPFQPNMGTRFWF